MTRILLAIYILNIPRLDTAFWRLLGTVRPEEIFLKFNTSSSPCRMSQRQSDRSHIQRRGSLNFKICIRYTIHNYQSFNEMNYILQIQCILMERCALSLWILTSYYDYRVLTCTPNHKGVRSWDTHFNLWLMVANVKAVLQYFMAVATPSKSMKSSYAAHKVSHMQHVCAHGVHVPWLVTLPPCWPGEDFYSKILSPANPLR